MSRSAKKSKTKVRAKKLRVTKRRSLSSGRKKAAKKATKKYSKSVPKILPKYAHKKATVKRTVSYSPTVDSVDILSKISENLFGFEGLRLFTVFLETRYLPIEDKQLLLGLLATATHEELNSLVQAADKQTQFLEVFKKGKSTEKLIEARHTGAQMLLSFQGNNKDLCKLFQLCKLTNLNSHLVSLIKGFDSIVDTIARDLVGDSSALVKWGIGAAVGSWLKALMTLKNAKLLAVILLGLMITNQVSEYCDCKKPKA